MRIQLPPQISTDPDVNSGAQAWGTSLADAFAQIGFSYARVGAATVTFPGGSPLSTTLALAHGIPITGRPKSVQLTMNQTGNVGVFCLLIAGVPAAQGTIQVQAWTMDNSSPAAGVTCGFDWAAFN